MTVEVATIHVDPDSEEAFLRGFAKATEILLEQPGCQELRWGRRVEPELAYVLIVDWTDIQDHLDFRETADYKEFGALFRQHLSKPPEVVHFDPRD